MSILRPREDVEADEGPPAETGPVDRSELREALRTLEEAVKEAHATYVDTIARPVAALAERLAEVKDRHAAIRRDLPLEEWTRPETDGSEAGTEEWRDLWHCVSRYRHRLREDVLGPLGAYLESSDLAQTLVDARAAWDESVREAVEAVPEHVPHPRPETGPAPPPGASWVQRGRAIGWTVTRHLQALMRGRRPDPPFDIPLRRRARSHLQGRLSREHASLLDAVEGRTMGWWAQMERVATDATHRLIAYERRLDHLDFHHARPADAAALGPPLTSQSRIQALEARPEPPSEDDVGVIREVVEQVDAVLAAGASLGVDDLCDDAEQQVDDALQDVRASADRPWEEQDPPESALAHSRPWPEWEEQVRARVTLCGTILGFYADIEAERDRLIDEVTETGPERVASSLDRATNQIEEQKNRVQELLREADVASEVPQDPLERPIQNAVATVEKELGALRNAGIEADLRDVVESSVERIQTLVAELPAEVRVHDVPDGGAPPDASATERRVSIRSGAEETWDVLFFDRLRTATRRLSDAVAGEFESVEEALEVIAFARDAVREELTDSAEGPPEGGSSGKEESATPLQAAVELATGGLSRSVRTLDRTQRHMDAATARWADTVWTAFRQGLVQLQDRWSSRSRVRNRLSRVGSLVNRTVQDTVSDAQQQMQQRRTQTRRWIQGVRRQVQQTWRAGRSALGLRSASEEDVHETVKTVASVDEMIDRLPVVYRRLFSFQPVDDPDLFIGREADRAFVEQHVQRWQQGIPAPLVLIGDRGTGVTSLLKIVRATTLHDAQLHHLHLDERPPSERALAEKLRRALRLSVSSTQGRLDLDDVGRALRDTSEPRGIRACFVEHLEHLLLRTREGTDLLNRMLTFMARTDAYVLWMGTISTAAWSLLEQKVPEAARLVTRRRLQPLRRDALEELIMDRHRRSGLDLHFAPEVASDSLFARLLRRAADGEEREARRTAYFDRLHKVSQQNVTLALFYWFRSLHPRDDGQGLRVKPIRPLSFEMLDRLTLEQAFALRAFLVHATLTVDEYSEVAQISASKARDMMEALGNASLIEPRDPSPTDPSNVHFEAIYGDTRYRIRPLLVAPIKQHLRSRNVLHSRDR